MERCLRTKFTCAVFALLLAAFFIAVPAPAAPAAAPAGEGKAEIAASEGNGKVGLGGLIAEAAENNPELVSARLAWESVKLKYPQVTSYEDPMLTYTEPIREIETRLGPQERMVGLSQAVPFPGKLGLKGEIVAREIEIARIRYEKALRELAARVKREYYELYYIDKAIELAGENEAVLGYFAEVSRSNYGLSVSQLDELVRAQKMSADASLSLITLDKVRQGVVARLNTLLYRPPDHPVGRVEEPELKPFTHSQDDVMALALENFEGLKMAELRLRKSELEGSLARYSYLPDFRIGVNYSQIGDPPAQIADAGEDAYSVTLGMNLPIWFGKKRAAVSQAGVERQRQLMEKNAVTNALQNDVQRIYSDLRNSERVVELYGNRLVPEARESLEFAEARYRTGEEMLGRLLETQSLWLNFRLVYYRSFADYLKSIAELEVLTSSELY